YHDGEYLSGYSASGRAAELLVALGLAEEVYGWGTLVETKAITALGTEFTYPAAAAFARPALEAKQDGKDAAAQERQAKFDEARRTGKPVLLRSWTDECEERDFDCSL